MISIAIQKLNELDKIENKRDRYFAILAFENWFRTYIRDKAQYDYNQTWLPKKGGDSDSNGKGDKVS